jgi:hypothetical protein
MLTAITVGSTGLVYFACHVDQVNRRVDHDTQATPTMVSHYKAVRIWLPQTLVDVARRRAAQAPINSHEELRRVLDREALRDVWYALTVREHHENGGFNDLTVIRRPYHDRHHFLEFPHVLAAIAGEAPADRTMDFSVASVSVVPQEFRDRTPHEVIGQALGQGIK